MNATGRIQRINLRCHRAARLTAAVFDAIKSHLDDDVLEPVHSALLNLFTAEGIEVLSDADRAALGLSQRGPDGWTTEEIIALDRRSVQIMTTPLVSPIFVEAAPMLAPVCNAVLIAFDAQRDPIPDSDLGDEQPISLNVRLTLGDVRKMRRVL